MDAATKTTPFWHEAAPPEPRTALRPPEAADVAIVGSGFTGLAAALRLAEAGRSVVVLEAGAPGAGASTRNGGMIGWGHRANLAGLSKRYGEAAALGMLAEARASLAFTTDLIGKLGADLGYLRTGRFLGAASPAAFADLVRWAEQEAPRLGMEASVVPEAEQGAHVATDLYAGGLHFPQHGGLHPARFHRALLDAARAAGALVIDHATVSTLEGSSGAFRLETAKGPLAARDVIWAGNGYARIGGFAALAKRLIPVPSTIIATESLGPNRVSSLFPSGAMVVETFARHSYYRPDPAGERVLWGGRASLNPLPEAESGRRLRGFMLSAFPELAEVALTHSWKGFVAFTFDGVPHLGAIDGVHYACGYNGSGVAMAPYLGWRLAGRVLGSAEDATGFDAADFRAPPLYRGTPWFLAGVELLYKLRDAREIRRMKRRRRAA